MTVTVAYVESGVVYFAPDTVPWAYEEAGIVYVREFPPVLTVDSEGRVVLRLPADGTLTYERWGERPNASLAPSTASTEFAGASSGSKLSASGPGSSLVLDTERTGLE